MVLSSKIVSLIIFLLLPLLCNFSSGAPNLEADRATLMAFHVVAGRAVLPWNASVTLCSWLGVKCDGGRITQLHLPGSRLFGQIPVGMLGKLTVLQSVSLCSNLLSGPLRLDLIGCKELHGVHLQKNHFSGGISVGLFSLGKLVRLNLASNSFTGGISPAFNNLRRLKMLFLEINRLSGEIPNLGLPNLVQFNMSFNPLNGPIPAWLRLMNQESFLGTNLCGGPLRACRDEILPPSLSPSSPTNAGRGKNSKLSGEAITGIAIGTAVDFLIMVALLVIIYRRGGGSKMQSVEVVAGGNAKSLVFFDGGPKVYDLEDLLRASLEMLGKGKPGTTYKAMLEVGMVAAVKRLNDVNLPEKEFEEKIGAICMMDHQNLVPLQAFYYSRAEKLLIYDYMPIGSLSSLLHGELLLLLLFLLCLEANSLC